MKNPRLIALASGLAILSAILVWQWISGWGLVSLNVRNAPLSKILPKIERQSGLKIVTNAPADAQITMKVTKRPAFEVLDLLSVQLDGNVRLAYLAAPTEKQIDEIVAAFKSNEANPPEWTVYGPQRFRGPDIASQYDLVVDPRTMTWAVSDIPEKKLQEFFSQGSQKTGVLFATPKDWNPDLSRLPRDGKVRDVAQNVTKAASGKLREYVLLSVDNRDGGGRERRGDRQQASNEEGGPRQWMGGSRGALSPRWNRGGQNEQWGSEFAQSQIARLPTDQQEEAKKQFNEVRNFFASLRDLPEDQRRAKMEEFMNDPRVQEKMDERMAARDAKSTPEKREQRFRRYVDRKQQMKSQ